MSLPSLDSLYKISSASTTNCKHTCLLWATEIRKSKLGFWESRISPTVTVYAASLLFSTDSAICWNSTHIQGLT
jgi:hypothetical protein